jgi:hypothetical protein
MIAPRVLVVLILASSAIGAEAAPSSWVAIVATLSGDASVTEPGHERRKVERFDCLREGSRLEIAPAARLTLAFATGARYELGPGASARVAADGVVEASGTVTTLPPVPPLPRIAIGAESTDRSLAVRIRGTPIRGLYPAHDAAVLADHAILRFAPVAGTERYEVEIEDADGSSVLRVQTQAATVAVSSGVLKPGARYQWSVRTLGTSSAAPDSAARGEADFVTLAAADQQARARLHEASPTADASSLALLAAIDRGLGLHWEAREGFRQALSKSPDGVAVRAALQALDEVIADGAPGPR